MTPERLTAWIYKTCPGGVRLHLVHEQQLLGCTTIASWSREDVDDARENPIPGASIAEQVLEAATEHTDSLGEPAKFLVQWIGREAQPLRTMFHRCMPAMPDSAIVPVGNATAANAAGMSAIERGQYLSHIATQQKIITGSIGVVLTAFERALSIQTRMCEALATRLDNLPPTAAADFQNEDFMRAKIRAFEAACTLIPDVGRLAILAAQRAIGGGDDTAEPPPAAPAGGVS